MSIIQAACYDAGGWVIGIKVRRFWLGLEYDPSYRFMSDTPTIMSDLFVDVRCFSYSLTISFIGRGERSRMPLKRGIYENDLRNAAYVSGPKAKSAYDLDMGERIPISEVTEKFLRKAEPQDRPSSRYLE